jgi:hypothetical protein
MLCTVAVALKDVPAPGLGDALVMQDNYDWGGIQSAYLLATGYRHSERRYN